MEKIGQIFGFEMRTLRSILNSHTCVGLTIGPEMQTRVDNRAFSIKCVHYVSVGLFSAFLHADRVSTNINNTFTILKYFTQNKYA